LFYNEVNANQIKQLTELLMEKNYIKVKERLKLKGLRTGFICLFFGIPETGKTETVFQIARISERNIMPIDISATKSHWFGDSEKIIREIFLTYRQRVKKAEKRNLPVPILLLNEADAVINKRKDTAISGVAQTENAIQNIILEELEKLEGIMIATTNLTENIDTAFDRRFIYKLEFQKPEIDTRRLIWKSIIPELSTEDTQKLAATYDFTGGQIENIARKRTINDILNEKESELSDLFRFCDEETQLKNDKKIGF
jgi:SpoVK/Ycf46/Vps4 family AAA+-type ATPase